MLSHESRGIQLCIKCWKRFDRLMTVELPQTESNRFIGYFILVAVDFAVLVSVVCLMLVKKIVNRIMTAYCFPLAIWYCAVTCTDREALLQDLPSFWDRPWLTNSSRLAPFFRCCWTTGASKVLEGSGQLCMCVCLVAFAILYIIW